MRRCSVSGIVRRLFDRDELADKGHGVGPMGEVALGVGLYVTDQAMPTGSRLVVGGAGPDWRGIEDKSDDEGDQVWIGACLGREQVGWGWRTGRHRPQCSRRPSRAGYTASPISSAWAIFWYSLTVAGDGSTSSSSRRTLTQRW